MLSNIIIRSAAAFGGAPFRLSKCTALGSAAGGVASGAAFGGAPGAVVGGALGLASSSIIWLLCCVYFVKVTPSYLFSIYIR